MMKKTTLAIILTTFAAIMTGCCPKEQPFPTSYKNVFIVYSAGYNNLSGPLATDIEFELAKGNIPDKYGENAILVFSHSSRYSGPYNYEEGKDPYYLSTLDYKTPVEPVLIRLYKENGTARLDTVKRYDVTFDEVDPNCLNQVLFDAKNLCPSNNYGLLYTSHGSGWLPRKIDMETDAVGVRMDEKNQIHETDIKDLANAIPMHLNYIIFDACYMGAVEVACQLRSVCNYFIGSATEIPDSGFDYLNLPSRLFGSAEPDLEGVCKDYINVSRMGGTIALVECNKIDALATYVAELVDKYRFEIYDISVKERRSTVQKYWCSAEYRYFYDLEDIFAVAGAAPDEIAELDRLITNAVKYELHTNIFNRNLELINCCGLSMYLPSTKSGFEVVNNYYKTLEFGKITKLVE